jgi:D-alanyl-D-alanine carboxypeptidase/D-alanyl-D-alanine-endopeptidase (penicillin-binding protein 4)
VSGSFEAGQEVVSAILRSLGAAPQGATLRDGSGLSHKNRVAARQLVDLLLCMHQHRYAAVFEQSLARAGEPGSMQRRFNDPLLRGRLRGKTGTLAGVHTLAGYLTRPDGTVLAFVLLVNGPGATDLPVQVCRVLASAESS